MLMLIPTSRSAAAAAAEAAWNPLAFHAVALAATVAAAVVQTTEKPAPRPLSWPDWSISEAPWTLDLWAADQSGTPGARAGTLSRAARP